MAMRVGQLQQKAIELLLSIPPEVVADATAIGAKAFAVCFTARTFYVAVGRACGFYSPSQYHLFPRLPWRGPYKVYLSIKKWYERAWLMRKGPTGGLAGALPTMTQLYKPGKLLLGRAYAFGIPLLQPIGIDLNRHGFMFAQTGGGKTTLLISMISCWTNSVFLIDPKNQITHALSKSDRRTWYIFDPKGKYGYNSIQINPLDVMINVIEEEGLEAGVEWAIKIACALIEVPPGNKSPFFYETPQGFMVGIILHVYTYHGKENCHLPFIRDLIKIGYRVLNEHTGVEETTEEDAFLLLLIAMRNNRALGELIPGAAATFLSAGKETLGNVKATLYQKTTWLDIPYIRAAITTSEFDLRDLKRRDDVVFSFVAPVLSLRQSLAPLARLLITVLASVFEEEKRKKGQCLMIVDEFPSIGRMEMIIIALAVLRDYGLIFLGISQGLELLQSAYPKEWRAFISNADFVAWAACSEIEILEYISKLIGKSVAKEKDKYSGRIITRVVDVLEPEQVGRLIEAGSNRMLVTQSGKRATVIVNDPYFKALPVWKYLPNPDHRETILRRISRALFVQKPSLPAPLHSECKSDKSVEPDSQEREDNNIDFSGDPNQKQTTNGGDQ